VRFWYDCEFLEDGRTIDLISIGIVAEDGREYYAINNDVNWRRVREHPWLMDNVVPHLPQLHGDWRNIHPAWLFDYRAPEVKGAGVISHEVEAFIRAGGDDRADHELWAYYGAYDHVALCQLWGRMIDLPGCVPMWTHDVMQLLDRRDLRHVNLSNVVPQQNEHHALADARWNRDAYEWIKSTEDLS
jgi:hypothetical protein